MKTAKVLALLLFTAPALWGQNPLSKDSRLGIPPFEVDFASFADTAKGKTRLEVYYKLRNIGFSFVKKGEEYQAAYDLEISVVGPSGREAASRRSTEEFSVKSYGQTQSAESYRINATHFSLPPGRYQIKVQVTDQNSREISSTERKAELPDLGKEAFALSDLELIGAFADSAGLALFKKENRTAIPSVSRLFGVPDTLLPFYFELYANRPKEKNCLLTCEISQRYHGSWAKKSFNLTPELPITPVFAELPTGLLPPGEYRLKVSLKAGKKELAKREAVFRVNWNWETALVHNFDDVLKLLRYFSRETDLKKLKKTPAEKRKQAWDEFWSERDPTAATGENEAKDEFDQRVRFADAYFGHMGLPGWRSDMGRIYIRYGEPDQVDEDLSGGRSTNPHVEDFRRYSTTVSRIRQTGHPNQTWYYFNFRRAFFFEDVTGSGSWVLKPPFDGRGF